MNRNPVLATRDTQILGHVIPKGTEIVLHLGHAGLHDTVANAERTAAYDHRRGHLNKKSTRSWLDDGSSFNPDRWLDEKGDFDERAGLTLPFGGGPRLCFGYRLAVSRDSSTPRFHKPTTRDF
jgi:cytochrome P450